MKLLRDWSVRRARMLWQLYRRVCAWAPRLQPVVRGLGEERAQGLLAPLERQLKGAFFDCRMCGDCRLSSTGMACPMNCGKQMRNGPCGGVRADGGCEVHPGMRCVQVGVCPRSTGGCKVARPGCRRSRSRAAPRPSRHPQHRLRPHRQRRRR